MYEITAQWAEGSATTVKSGDVLTAEWRVNVNDDAEAPANDPVDNVNFTLTIESGTFEELPSSCLTSGVDPVSSISADGKTMICNIGTKDEGTSHVVQTPIRADGETGSQLTGSGTIDGTTADLTPVNIVNDFGMDIRWAVATGPAQISGAGTANPIVDLGLQWTLSKDKRSEAGPQTVSYDLQISSAAATSIAVGPNRCTAFTEFAANGHPWSGGSHPADQMADTVDTCTIQQLGPNTFRLTLTGIDYNPTNPPTKDSTGAGLPADQITLTSGTIWLRLAVTGSGSVNLVSSAPTYTSAAGTSTAQDDAANNTVSKTWTFPGAFTSPWSRGYTGSGGSPFDATYVVSPGTRVQQGLITGLPGFDRADNLQVGMCAPLDTRFLTFADFRPTNDVPGSVMQYYVGTHPTVTSTSAGYNPQAFPDCGGSAGWTTTKPADLSTVKAVRVTFTQGQAEAANLPNNHAAYVVESVVKQNVATGQDIWNFMYNQAGAGWSAPTTCATPTPGLRYPCTVSAGRDLVRIVSTTPFIEKSADRSAVNPGQPTTFSLNYSANVASNLPTSVDDYTIVDTLPVGVTYIEGSADPAPTVTTNGSGQQVLTWVLDGVPTNVQQAITYQAVAAANIAPGTVLTNSAVASVSGATSRPATAQITIASNGYTSIGKTADVPYIPNLNGDGTGEGSWTVTLRSFDPLPQDFTDTIDILPFAGDDRGTDFTGDYELTGVDAPAGATVYYTTADPATLSDDPADASNGAAGDPSGNTVGWTTTFTASATAVRVVGPELAAGGTQQFTVNIATDGVEGGDVLVNRAQARSEHTELVMRTSAPITVANYYSASLKKYVMGADGEWHDANTVEDYPTYRVGDKVPYRIVIVNTGQGTLTDLEITDDLFPDGSFTVDELAPGAEEAHEFEMTLTEGGLDTVVNTACATAAIPGDSQVPPTINCDPAGMEVDGDPTHTKELVSATAIGEGRWELVYGIDVTNESTHPTSYDLADTLHFTDQATIVSAEVTTSPAGVTLADPAWDGQGETLIASDVPLLGTDDVGYTAHRYEVTVIATVPLQLEGAGSGADDPTQCGAAGDDADRAFNNTSQLTDPEGATEDDQACAEIPSIDITKGVSSGPTPNGDGTWTVTYDIVATNTGAEGGVYDVRDRMTADGDLEVISGAVTSAPDGVTTSPTWTGLGAEGAPENDIATGVTLPAGGVHTYQVEVVIGIAEGTEGAPIITDCSEEQPGGPGGLSNSAEIEHNDLTDDATACITIGIVTVDKTVSSGPTPNGDGTWTVVYDIVATHVGAADADYDVTDRLHFGEGIEIVDHEVRSLDGIDVNPDWTGLGSADTGTENVIAEDVTLSVGGSHTYQVEVTVQMDEATIDPGELVCAPAGSGESGGLGNSTTLTSNGITGRDDVCPSLPKIVLNKTVVDGSPIANGDGTWTIEYDVTATNTGQATGQYDMTDRLRYGNGIEIESATVVSGPDGVTTNPDWTGQGAVDAAENVISTDVDLDAGEAHTYRVRVVASMDREIVTPGDLVCPTPGSNEPGGFSNTAGLTHNGEDQDADACVTPPLIEITKSLSGAVTPVDGQDGVYDATYELTVTNSGPGAGVYDLDDRLAPGEGVTVVGIQDVTTDAPNPVAINGGFDGIDDLRIVTGQPIAGAAEGAPVVHTYSVTVRYSVNLAGIEVPAGDTCLAENGESLPGTLNNTATVGWNGLDDDDAECIVPGKPTLDKAIISAKPIGNGQWEVVYDLTVGNTGDEATTYDLDDELLFAKQVAVASVSVTGPEGIIINNGFNGDSDQRIATDVDIAGLDDDGYAPHVYRVTVIANVPLTFDPADVGDDGAGSPACTVAPGGNFIEQGLNNAATLTDETGGTIVDTDCAGLPSTKITKTMDGAPLKGTNGQWTVNYTITVLNDGAVAGDYTLTDQLRYGAGIEILDATIVSAPEGVTPAATWTGQGETGAAENVVATDVSLAAGASHLYRVTVEARLDTDAADGTTLTCPAPGSTDRGGFANTAGVDHNDLIADASACDVPEWPEDVPPPLATTGGTIALGTISAALLLLVAGGVLLYTRRRRVVDAE
ncbi:hypothetical protein KZC56_17375 [Microbacterium sp. SSW1-47]|uniref:DUF7507 domain-containing protein n=1 Tax=Microbacterium sufflavum TaxID=2851649 RepID=UPI001FFD5375|nr:hypothetical protein [Microbacterium sufflavum]MCK2028071.1 hypothetical protein [Microbacterium sufflavum]